MTTRKRRKMRRRIMPHPDEEQWKRWVPWQVHLITRVKSLCLCAETSTMSIQTLREGQILRMTEFVRSIVIIHVNYHLIN